MKFNKTKRKNDELEYWDKHAEITVILVLSALSLGSHYSGLTGPALFFFALLCLYLAGSALDNSR